MSDDLRRAFRDNVRLFRGRRGLSQARLARLLGRDQTWVYQLESGDANPTLATIEQLAHDLQVAPLELLQPVSQEELDALPRLPHAGPRPTVE